MSTQHRLRWWCAGASAIAQVAATAGGMLPWWALPVTLTVTVAVARPTERPIDPRRIRLTRGLGVAAVALFAALIAVKTVGAGSEGADPIATLRSLTGALVVLSLVMAPSARTPREYRVWLTVTTGVLVAAAVGGHSRSSAVLSLTSWVILLTATTEVQAAAEAVEGTVQATAVLSGAVRRRPQSRAFGTAVPVVASLAAGGLIFFALPQGLGGGGLANKIAGQVKGSPQDETATRNSVGVDTFGDGQLSLLVRGSLPDTPMLDVPSASPVLWRGTFYSVYTGSSWIADDATEFQLARGNSVHVPASSLDPTPAGHSVTYPVTFAPGFASSLIWAPGVLQHVQGLGGQISGITREAANARLIDPSNVTSYAVTSDVATTTPATLRAAHGSDPSDPQWTQLPRSLPAEIAALARQITANAPDRYQQVRDIESYLRAHETYTLAAPVPPAGHDAVDQFLFHDHEGFCEQFASAEAVLLRTIGVPTRVVTGLAYGTAMGRTRVFTASNAHAWDEVYYPGVGWSPSDPTAGARLAPGGAASTSTVSRLVDRLSTMIPGGKTVLAVALFGLLIGLGFLVRSLVSGRGGGSQRSRHADRIGPVLAAFHRFAGHRHAPAPRATTETAREYLRRVSPPGELDAAVDALEQECYGAVPLDDVTEAAAVAAFASMVKR